MNHLMDYNLIVKNPTELIDILKQTQLTDGALITVLDFVSLYPSIRLEPCFCALRDLLLAKCRTPTHRKQALELAHLMCYNSIFQFNNRAYIQKRGVPMGSPLSGDLCELVLRKLEENIIPQYSSNMVLYKRYVDDVFIIWKTNTNIFDFVGRMNNNPYGLTLKIDQMSNTKIHFLDIDIKLNGTEIETGIYYKPGYIPWFIPARSADPYTYKIAAFRALVRRAYTHPSKLRDTKMELRRIERIAMAHGYEKELVRKLARSYSRTRDTQDTHGDRRQEPNSRYAVVEYSRRLKTLYRKIATKTSTRVAYKRSQDIYKLLRNVKDKLNPLRAPGVYSILLRDDRFGRELLYIGSTKRSIQQRVKEHKYDLSHERCTTALSTYASDPEIHADLNNTRLINAAFQTDDIRALEALEIYRAGRTGKCINTKDGNTLSYAWRYICDEYENGNAT
ncbi:uncharacterized protein [Centruroides vittatus]|uniref:uncharacterized protein n=1 Tax=Centruroides vittatus TaxID=120091 RepID=UPI00350FC8B0